MFTEAEINALLARHLVEARGIRLRRRALGLSAGMFELMVQSPGQLLEESRLPLWAVYYRNGGRSGPYGFA